MKISAFAAAAVAVPALLSLAVPAGAANHDHDEECTHGKLYVLDNETSLIHIFDVSEGMLQNLTVESTLTLPSSGAGELVYYGAPADPLIVQYRGQLDQGYQDGFVRVIDTGFEYHIHNGDKHVEYEAPSIVQNALIDNCARPIHQVRHDDKVAIFCDGSFEHDPQVNTTVHVVDETKLGSTTESAIVFMTELPGTHHGVAIPVDDGHLLHSVALPDRVLQVNGSSSLPATFQVVDYNGQVLHELSNTSNPDTHCSGFHGSASVDNTFALGCDAVHGGIVIVDYDPSTETYTSRAVAYPDNAKYDNFRIGSFAYHKNADHMVGSFTLRGGTEFHLVAIAPSTTAFEESNVMTLESAQCGFQFEVGMGEHLLVFMPNGFLHAFEVSNGTFTEVAKKEIVPGMSACSQAAFVAGIGQAFVATPETKTLYAVDLAHVKDGEMDVHSSTLDFFPSGMTVSGFSYKAVCKADDHHPTTSAANKISMMGLLAMATWFFAF